MGGVRGMDDPSPSGGLGLAIPLPKGDFIPVPSGTGRASFEAPPEAVLSLLDIAIH